MLHFAVAVFHFYDSVLRRDRGAGRVMRAKVRLKGFGFGLAGTGRKEEGLHKEARISIAIGQSLLASSLVLQILRLPIFTSKWIFFCAVDKLSRRELKKIMCKFYILGAHCADPQSRLERVSQTGIFSASLSPRSYFCRDDAPRRSRSLRTMK